MKINVKGTIFALSVFFIFIHTSAFSVSTSVKAQRDYSLILDTIRKMETMVKNFPENENTKQFNTIKKQFETAGVKLFGQDYTASYETFKALKINLIKLLGKISKSYLERTKTILDSTSKESFDIFIDFGPRSSLARYFQQPYDPLRDIKPYTKKKEDKDSNKNAKEKKDDDINRYGPEDYHFFWDKHVIRNYLDKGYHKYQNSQNLFDDPEFDYIRNKKNKTQNHYKYIILRYMDIIKLCRESKQYGIEIHKIMRIHELGDILRKYNISGSDLTPIFDDRIPENFKVDAIDNKKLLHQVEKERFQKIVELSKKR